MGNLLLVIFKQKTTNLRGYFTKLHKEIQSFTKDFPSTFSRLSMTTSDFLLTLLITISYLYNHKI